MVIRPGLREEREERMRTKPIPNEHVYRGKTYGIFEIVPHKKGVSIEKARLSKLGVEIATVDGRKDFGGYLIYARMKDVKK